MFFKILLHFFGLCLFISSAYASDVPPVMALDQKQNQQVNDNNMNTNNNPRIKMQIGYNSDINASEDSLKDNNWVEIELYQDKAPKHVERIMTLAKNGFYNGLKFHRVIDNFMAQTGDPKGDGTGGSDLPNLAAEFNDVSHRTGVVSMARASDPNSANSQFFIMLADATYLDNQYTAFGRVISGMEFISKIKKGDNDKNGVVVDPDYIKAMQVIDIQSTK